MMAITRSFSIVAACLTLALPSAALAQSDNPGRLAEEVKREFADCVVKRMPEMASEVILANADNETISEDYGELVSSRCLTAARRNATTLRMSGDAFRYALAEALIRAEDVSVDAEEMEVIAPLDHIQPRDEAAYEQKLADAGSAEERREVEREHQVRTSVAYMSQFGECVVRHDPMNSGRLLDAEPLSDEETATIAALQPALGACVNKDRSIRLDRTSLRGTLAMNYYRLAHAASGSVH